ncbi:c-type cytochrome [Comamonas composti]|uniref:c-type cytochrome n=1 Tax=Comamonas composti TaxID=408558 RepID=UPI0003F82C1B|nr:hypothetical protein [Comamonas composti]
MAKILQNAWLAACLGAITCNVLAVERSAEKNYLLRCVGCHGQDGAGAPNQGIPAFPGLLDPLYSNDLGRTYLTHVPGVRASSLSANEIAAVLNHVAQRWAKAPHELERFTAEEVQVRQKVEVPDIVALRRHLTGYFRARGIELAPYPWP